MPDLTATYYPVKLPSRCLLYSDIAKDNSSDQIKIRSFKGRDEKLIAEISSDNFEKKLLMAKSISEAKDARKRGRYESEIEKMLLEKGLGWSEIKDIIKKSKE